MHSVTAVKSEATIIRRWASPNIEGIQRSTNPSEVRGVNRSGVYEERVGVREVGTRKTKTPRRRYIRKQCNEEEQVMVTGKVSEVRKSARSGGSPHSESNNQQRLWQSNRQA